MSCEWKYTLPLQIDFIVRGGNSTPEQLKERSEALAKALQKAFIRRHDFQSLVNTSSKSEKKKAADTVQPTGPNCRKQTYRLVDAGE